MSLFGNLNNNQSKPSLFSTPAAPAQTGSSLFSGLNASKPAQSSTPSLFGAPSQAQQTQQQPASSGGLFGGLNSATQNKPAASGLFGNTTQSTQPSQTTSLFGTAPQSQPQQPSSLFGSAPQSQPQSQPQQAASSSLFGGPAQSQQQPASQPQQEQSAPKAGALFDSLLEKSRKRPRGETTLDDMPNLHFGLTSIQSKLRTLGPNAQNRSNGGRAHYLLSASGVDPNATARDLNYFESQTTGIDKSQATAAQDTDVESYLANLQTQTTLGMIADGLARSIRDFDAFLDDHVTMEWDVQRKRIYQHFGIKARDIPSGTSRAGVNGLRSEGQGGFGASARRSKVQAMNGSRGPGATNNTSVFGRSNMQQSVIGTPAPIGTGHQSLFPDVEKKVEAIGSAFVASPKDRFLREKQQKYLEKVQHLNLSRLRGHMYPLLRELAGVEAQSSDQHVQHVVNAYNALIEMIGEDPEIRSLADPKAIRERHFADAYLDDTPNSAKAMKVRKMILAGANRYLEKQFYQELESLVIKNPKEANLGGVPSVLNKVKAYVRLRAVRNDLSPDDTNLQVIGDDYAWPIVFYLLRAGYVKDAAEYVTSNAVAFRAIDRNFVTYITDYYNSSDRRLRRELQDRINNEYNQRLRVGPDHTIDPYRMACYKVIGRCGIDTRTIEDCNQGINDWIWLQFNLAREVNRVDEVASEVYGLDEIRHTVKEIGSRHFAKGAGDQNHGLGMYFYLQVLAGLFEEAVAYLYTSQYVDAVHFAIGLEYYGLLRASDPVSTDSDLLTRNVRELPQVSFGRMLGYYTRDFRAANVAAAVDYLTLICLNKDLPGEAGQQQIMLCHEALRELVLESREFSTLLGDIRGDGQRAKGCIEERLKLIGLENAGDFMRTVTIQAASMADENGRTTDAVLLFHLAEEFDNVIVIINRALSEAVATDIGQDQLRLAPLKPRIETGTEPNHSQSLSLTAVDDPIELAKNMMMVYNANALVYSKIRQQNREACGVLLRMSEAKNMVTKQRWTEALDIIESLSILPLKAQGDSQQIRSAATSFSSLPQVVARNVPNLMAWAVESCIQQSSHLSHGQFGGNDGARRILLAELNQKQQDLLLYSSTIKYKLPANVSGLLARAGTQQLY